MSRHYADQDEPWFRLGRLDVTSSTLAALIAVASVVLVAISPLLFSLFYFQPQLVIDGQIWRAISWPLANSLGGILNALMLWYFGNDLERLVGRYRMLWLFVGIWAALTVSAFLIMAIPGFENPLLAGINLIEVSVLLLWIAEYPHRPFFFGIQAWIWGVILVGIDVLGLISVRNFGGLLSLVVALGLTAIMGRRFGLLSAYDWIPGRPATVGTTTANRQRIVHRPRAKQDKQAEQRLSDRERLDELLDQIADRGIDSLTAAQRREMMRLRDRIRRP